MKTSPISIAAFLLSVVACIIAFMKQPSEKLIQEALDRREKELIRDLAPKIVVMSKNLGTYEQLKPKSDPSSIEEMVAPFFKMVSTVGQ
jgi:hypothetical protein